MRTLAVAIIFGLVGFFAWQAFDGDDAPAARRGRPPAPVTVFDVERQAFRESIPALGTLQALESIDITSPVSQLVSSLNFEDGEVVEKGRVLATLRQAGERASLRELEARLAEARREVKRLTDLAKKNQVAQTDLDSAQTEVQVLLHQKSEVESRIADRTIVAPFSGVLGLREVSEGALVDSGQRLTTLDDLSRMRLQFTVPERFLGALKAGMTIKATTTAYPEVFEGELVAIDSRIDPIARSVTARAVIDNSDGRLRPGLLMEIQISGDAQDVILVPEESLQSRAARHFVWKIDGDQALRTEVVIGQRIPGWVVIDEGITDGDQVVRDGVIRLAGNAMPIRRVSGA